MPHIIADTFLSFPGLGIDPFKVDPVAIKNIFGRQVMWYGVIICIGMVLAVLYAMTRAKIEKIKTDDIIDLAMSLIVFGIIGARAYYVIFSLDDYIVKGDFLRTLGGMVAIWNGGLAIYGAIIAGVITIFVFCKIKKMRFSTILDVAAPAVMIGQIIGRWGNFVNAEAHGAETSLPWRMGISNTAEAIDVVCYHPTFLYESLWNLLGFIIIHSLYKKKKFNGQVFLMYMTLYGLGRTMIEGLRTDSLMMGQIRASQLLAMLTFVAGVILLIINFVNLKRYNAVAAGGVSATDLDTAGGTDEVAEEKSASASESEAVKENTDSNE